MVKVVAREAIGRALPASAEIDSSQLVVVDVADHSLLRHAEMRSGLVEGEKPIGTVGTRTALAPAADDEIERA